MKQRGVSRRCVIIRSRTRLVWKKVQKQKQNKKKKNTTFVS